MKGTNGIDWQKMAPFFVRRFFSFSLGFFPNSGRVIIDDSCTRARANQSSVEAVPEGVDGSGQPAENPEDHVDD